MKFFFKKQSINHEDSYAEHNTAIGHIKGRIMPRSYVKIQKIYYCAKTQPVDNVTQRAAYNHRYAQQQRPVLRPEKPDQKPERNGKAEDDKH